jgi:hypothetical protein
MILEFFMDVVFRLHSQKRILKSFIAPEILEIDSRYLIYVKLALSGNGNQNDEDS